MKTAVSGRQVRILTSHICTRMIGFCCIIVFLYNYVVLYSQRSDRSLEIMENYVVRLLVFLVLVYTIHSRGVRRIWEEGG